MTTDELLEALKPFGVDLQYGVTPGKWCVLLMDHEFYTSSGNTPQEALQAAYDAMKAEEL